MWLCNYSVSLLFFLCQVLYDVEGRDDFAKFFSKYSDNDGDFFKKFQRFDGIENFLNDAQTFCKSFGHCSVKSIGVSGQNRQIYMVKISNGKPKNRAVWIDGGFHAREWLSHSSVVYLIKELLLNSMKNETHPTYGIDWYVTPVANPDGYVHTWKDSSTRLHRKTMSNPGSCLARKKTASYSDGVDMNRNFDIHWGETPGSSMDPCKEDYAGPAAFSEPESKAIRDVLLDGDIAWKAYVSVHTYGKVIYFPYAYAKRLSRNHKQLELVAKKMAKAMKKASGEHYSYGSSAIHSNSPTTGSSDDWAFDVLKLPFSYTLELRPDVRNGSATGFIASESAILPSGKEVAAAIGELAKAVKRLP